MNSVAAGAAIWSWTSGPEREVVEAAMVVDCRKTLQAGAFCTIYRVERVIPCPRLSDSHKTIDITDRVGHSSPNIAGLLLGSLVYSHPGVNPVS